MTQTVEGKTRRQRASTAPCRRCYAIRLFLMVALPLVGLMAVLPGHFDRIGPHLPPPEVFAVLVPLIGLPMFVIRLVRWHRGGRK